eukprot:GHVR01009631.1.p2 GENE.GHVR01009631.1~~GHVR01009631.1.p2  ORF type:complete len:147 (+),score=22.52 GHVR01009631.1:1045-1485(+)
MYLVSAIFLYIKNILSGIDIRDNFNNRQNNSNRLLQSTLSFNRVHKKMSYNKENIISVMENFDKNLRAQRIIEKLLNEIDKLNIENKDLNNQLNRNQYHKQQNRNYYSYDYNKQYSKKDYTPPPPTKNGMTKALMCKTNGMIKALM